MQDYSTKRDKMKLSILSKNDLFVVYICESATNFYVLFGALINQKNQKKYPSLLYSLEVIQL